MVLLYLIVLYKLTFYTYWINFVKLMQVEYKSLSSKFVNHFQNMKNVFYIYVLLLLAWIRCAYVCLCSCVCTRAVCLSVCLFVCFLSVYLFVYEIKEVWRCLCSGSTRHWGSRVHRPVWNDVSYNGVVSLSQGNVYCVMKRNVLRARNDIVGGEQ